MRHRRGPAPGNMWLLLQLDAGDHLRSLCGTSFAIHAQLESLHRMQGYHVLFQGASPASWTIARRIVSNSLFHDATTDDAPVTGLPKSRLEEPSQSRVQVTGRGRAQDSADQSTRHDTAPAFAGQEEALPSPRTGIIGACISPRCIGIGRGSRLGASGPDEYLGSATVRRKSEFGPGHRALL
jgi:hypothetical protein